MLISNLRLYLIFFVFCTSISSGYAQQDTVEVKDFSNSWTFLDGEENLPLVRKSDFKGKIIRFSVDVEEFNGAYLNIESPQEISILINDTFERVTGKQYILDFKKHDTIDGLLFITVYAENLNPYLLSTKAIKIVRSNLGITKSEVVLVNPREDRLFSNFFITVFIILSVYFATIYNLYPRVVSEYYNLRRAVSFREMDENLLKSRPLNSTNLLMLSFYSLLLAFIIISLVHFTNTFNQSEIFYPSTFFGAIWNWVKISLLIFALLTGKYILIIYFTSLFSINNFLNSHFFNFIRLGLIVLSAALALIVITQFGFNQTSLGVYNTLFNLIIISLGVNSIIIYFKLLNSTPFKNLHLFSYICATELIPFVIILSLGINKSF